MAENKTKYLTSNVHELYNQKLDIQQLVYYSYSGGQKYRDQNFLHKYTERETTASYKERLKRSIYFNNVQPLADMMVGFLYTDTPIRDGIKNKTLIEDISRVESFDTLMQKIATSSILMTTGVLVDSPVFDESEMTEQQRKDLNLKPIVSIYEPWKIRNFYHNDKGDLEWVVLDNSYLENSSPFEKQEWKYSLRLWTPGYYQDFISDNGKHWTVSAEYPNKIGEVPFIFSNWTDTWDTYITDTVFEDIALFDQSIYNYMSLFDENLYAGTFKMLAWPGKVPDEVTENNGFTNMMVVSFDQAASNTPMYLKPGLEDMEQFLSAIDFILVGIMRKLGLNTDLEKNYAQSGMAKSFDFKKVKSFLTSGAASMERVERDIIYYIGKWLGTEEDNINIEYNQDFLGEEQQQEFLNTMEAMASMPYSLYKKAAAKKIVDLTLKDIPQKESDEIKKEIDEDEEESNDEFTPLSEEEIIKMSEEEKNENND